MYMPVTMDTANVGMAGNYSPDQSIILDNFCLLTNVIFNSC